MTGTLVMNHIQIEDDTRMNDLTHQKSGMIEGGNNNKQNICESYCTFGASIEIFVSMTQIKL